MTYRENNRRASKIKLWKTWSLRWSPPRSKARMAKRLKLMRSCQWWPKWPKLKAQYLSLRVKPIKKLNNSNKKPETQKPKLKQWLRIWSFLRNFSQLKTALSRRYWAKFCILRAVCQKKTKWSQLKANLSRSKLKWSQLKANLSKSKTKWSQLKVNLSRSKLKLSQLKANLSKSKLKLSQLKANLSKTKDKWSQTKVKWSQTKDKWSQS